MDSVNTRDRIKAAALPLFAEQGFAATSIAAIESAAGLAPRAGAFYRHFDSKEALFEELAAERITETPGEFDFEGLRAFGDTRAELVALARRFEVAAERQQPYLRLIGEARLTASGRAFEQRANEAMRYRGIGRADTGDLRQRALLPVQAAAGHRACRPRSRRAAGRLGRAMVGPPRPRGLTTGRPKK